MEEAIKDFNSVIRKHFPYCRCQMTDSMCGKCNFDRVKDQFKQIFVDELLNSRNGSLTEGPKVVRLDG